MFWWFPMFRHPVSVCLGDENTKIIYLRIMWTKFVSINPNDKILLSFCMLTLTKDLWRHKVALESPMISYMC